ncbi:hypothetical protein GGX14DRAFT_404382 [Mycena pura]|uniref:Uncharacterized protein n=1 Tax=Mycena pura TaxID=153505 RepID=A0AAD6Y5B1_9AGAR|nr:hypothetical protein GGX14DRAFT_404382 [Mycena pura]
MWIYSQPERSGGCPEISETSPGPPQGRIERAHQLLLSGSPYTAINKPLPQPIPINHSPRSYPQRPASRRPLQSSTSAMSATWTVAAQRCSATGDGRACVARLAAGGVGGGWRGGGGWRSKRQAAGDGKRGGAGGNERRAGAGLVGMGSKCGNRCHLAEACRLSITGCLEMSEGMTAVGWRRMAGRAFHHGSHVHDGGLAASAGHGKDVQQWQAARCFFFFLFICLANFMYFGAFWVLSTAALSGAAPGPDRCQVSKDQRDRDLPITDIQIGMPGDVRDISEAGLGVTAAGWGGQWRVVTSVMAARQSRQRLWRREGQTVVYRAYK